MNITAEEYSKFIERERRRGRDPVLPSHATPAQRLMLEGPKVMRAIADAKSYVKFRMTRKMTPAPRTDIASRIRAMAHRVFVEK